VCERTKRRAARGWVSGCLGSGAVTMGAPWRTRAQATVASPAADTAHDSLLVSGSVYRGWKWFHVYCFRWHGEAAIGGVNPAAPDLRWALSASGANFPRDSFVYTALNGRLAKGMPSWKVLLDTSAIQALYVYVKAR